MKAKKARTSKNTGSTSTKRKISGTAQSSRSRVQTVLGKSASLPSERTKTSALQSSTRGAAKESASSQPDGRGAKKGRIIRVKLGESLGRDLTDWKRLRAMTEEEIEQNALDDLDNPPIEDWTNAKLILPVHTRKPSIHLRIDPTVLAWFRSQGPGYLTRMNAVLRNYYEAQKR
jgi:uncharacterized protein (DUF4415 family)